MSRPMSCWRLPLLAGMAALLVVACGGSSTAAPVLSPSGAPAASPTDVPASPAATLTQTLSAKSGGRSVRYPAGWIATDNLGILYVVSSQAANDRLIGLGTLQPGDVFVQFAENSILAGKTGDTAVHLPDNLKLLADGMGLALPAPMIITSAGRPGARIDAQNGKLAMIAISLKVRDDLFADIIAYVPPGEAAAREQLILSIVESLEYPAS